MTKTNPSGYCACGCGQTTVIANQNSANGAIKGQPNRYLFGHYRKSRLPEYVVDATTGCWLWQKGTSAGYGMVRVNGVKTQAHRAYYEKLVGPIPKNRVLHHTCLHRNCVNPEHLTPLNRREHLREHGIPCENPTYAV